MYGYVWLCMEIKSEVLFMKRCSTIFLKIAVILIGIPILALCIFWLPSFANYFHYPILIGVYATAIIVNIDVMLAKRKMSVTELTEKVGITMANLSILKNGKAKAVRFSTLEAICKALDCQPGDILEYRNDT